jgi:hypothetical protein
MVEGPSTAPPRGVGWATYEQWQALHDSLLSFGGLSQPTDVRVAFSDRALRSAYREDGSLRWP